MSGSVTMEREDLELAQWAKEQGFLVLASSNSNRLDRKPYNPSDSAPMFSLTFEMEDWVVWGSGVKWVSAKLVMKNGVKHYMYHRPYKRLKSALERVLVKLKTGEE